MRFVAAFLLTTIITAAASPALGQGALLYGGGEWDFEDGFHFLPNPLPDSGDDAIEVANGWKAILKRGPDGHRWADFNKNQFSVNVSEGTYSQEITATCSDGKSWLAREMAVPAGHQLRVEADVKATWSEVQLIVMMGVDPTGGLDIDSPGIQWKTYPEVPQATTTIDPEFHRIQLEFVAAEPRATLYIGMDHPIATCNGATFMVDNVEVYDLGAATATPGALPVGDINADGSVDDADLLLFSRHFDEDIRSDQARRADLNGDGVIDEYDVVRMMRILKGLE